jgi:hypothetical protein
MYVWNRIRGSGAEKFARPWWRIGFQVQVVAGVRTNVSECAWLRTLRVGLYSISMPDSFKACKDATK